MFVYMRYCTILIIISVLCKISSCNAMQKQLIGRGANQQFPAINNNDEEALTPAPQSHTYSYVRKGAKVVVGLLVVGTVVGGAYYLGTQAEDGYDDVRASLNKCENDLKNVGNVYHMLQNYSSAIVDFLKGECPSAISGCLQCGAELFQCSKKE